MDGPTGPSSLTCARCAPPRVCRYTFIRGTSNVFLATPERNIDTINDMRFLRPFVLGILLAGAFYWFTTHHKGVDPPNWVARPTHVELSEAAGPEQLDPEEQNNVEVYHK